MAGRAGRWVTALLALALGWNLRSAALFPLDRWDGREGPVLECLAKAPEGAVINLPYVRQQESLYYQTLHQKPLLGGMLVTKPSFGPPELKALLQENSLLAALLSIGQRNYSPTTTPLPEDRQALLGLGYRYVLVEIQGFLRPKPRGDGTADMVSDWGRARRLLSDRLEGSPAQEDDRFALWVLDGTPPCP
jgi:hypothetical protein